TTLEQADPAEAEQAPEASATQDADEQSVVEKVTDAVADAAGAVANAASAAVEAVADAAGAVAERITGGTEAVDVDAPVSVESADDLQPTGPIGYTGQIQGRVITLEELEAYENRTDPDEPEDRDEALLQMYEH